jgi:hypothetical protein
MIEGPVRILCDACSGACNPDELAKLLEGRFDLRTRNGLHAKVVITSVSVIIGSANASANRLGQESEEANNLESRSTDQEPNMSGECAGLVQFDMEGRADDNSCGHFGDTSDTARKTSWQTDPNDQIVIPFWRLLADTG